MKLKTLLLYRNRYLYIALSLTVLILVLNSFLYLVILFPLGFYLYQNHSDLIKIIVFVLVIYLVSLLLFNSSEIVAQDTYKIKVIDDVKIDEYTSFKGKINSNYIKVYFDEEISIKPGDILVVKGELETPSKSTIPNTFDYNNYLKSQGIKYTIFAKDVQYNSSSFSLYIIPYYIEKYINKYLPMSGDYVKTFILADKTDVNTEVKDQINETGISHLFAVSGLHIAMIVVALEFIFKKINIKKTNIENTIMAILLTYIVVTSFSPSVTRASIMYVLLVMNKRFKLEFSTLDILSIIMISLLIFRPYYYFNTGFLLSFLVTFTILLSKNILGNNTKINQLFLISFIAFLVTIPIILKINYQINLLTLVLNIIFLMYVSYIVLPLSYIAFFFPFFDRINYVFISLFEMLLKYISSVDFLILNFYLSNNLEIILYYLLVFIFLISLEEGRQYKERFAILTLTLLVFYFSNNLDPRKSVSFIDIYGDSTLIIDSFNQCNILIDTGEVDDYDSVINYIKNKNIRNLDYLIISHFHSDHYGESSDILNEFNVKNVISKNNVVDFEDKLIQCGSLSMFIYPFEYDEENENNNSIVMSLFINNKHYLFTGDIELSRELSFISKYDLDVDYLKVPHHGSITSSSQLFIDSIEPEEVFIIVSTTNLHGHPHSEVVKRYKEKGITVYRTDLKGTIEVYYLFGKEYKRIHSP